MRNGMASGMGTGWGAGGMAAGAAIAIGAVGYFAYAARAWLRYGTGASADRARAARANPSLDRLMPEYEVWDRHQARVRAEPEAVLRAARAADFSRSPVVSGIFKSREAILRALRGTRAAGKENPGADSGPSSRGVVDACLELGWGVLAEEPGREVVIGAATRPWDAHPEFRRLAPEAFTPFSEPGYVKIVWTLRVDPDAGGGAILSTETRALATDALARRRFRVYWAFLSPGIKLIRWVMLREARRDAEGGEPPAIAPPSARPPREKFLRS